MAWHKQQQNPTNPWQGKVNVKSMVTFWFLNVKEETGKDLSMSHALVRVCKKVYKQTNLVKGIYMYKTTKAQCLLVTYTNTSGKTFHRGCA